MKNDLEPADRNRLDDYLENIREIERRIQRIEAQNASGEERELPDAPVGVPDSFDEHVKLMFDLQAAAFASDITRVFAFKMGRDVSGRVYPGDRRQHWVSPGLASTASERSGSRSSRRSTGTTSAPSRTSSKGSVTHPRATRISWKRR